MRTEPNDLCGLSECCAPSLCIVLCALLHCKSCWCESFLACSELDANRSWYLSYTHALLEYRLLLLWKVPRLKRDETPAGPAKSGCEGQL